MYIVFKLMVFRGTDLADENLWCQILIIDYILISR